MQYRCETEDGRKATGSIASEMGGKIVASAVFLDLGITDAITDKHRKYADSYVIPIRKASNDAAAEPTQGELVQQCVDSCVKSSGKDDEACFDVCSN
ncbi:MAG: hypothetical protein HKO64_05780 [Xanthomonadales bacterium]|nr:hypothetical protein [Xanthomonadales bacterium]NNL95113.1 hypothetical protein [Xanthomonadales bacterium]